MVFQTHFHGEILAGASLGLVASRLQIMEINFSCRLSSGNVSARGLIKWLDEVNQRTQTLFFFPFGW